MKIIKINLLDTKTEFGFMPSLIGYLLDGNHEEKEMRPAILILPGGAYKGLSHREGERIALSYNAAGFHAFVLNYCVAPHTHPMPILNVAKAIEIMRKKSTEWNVAPDKIAVCGFSAGGHLAASISTLWNDADIFLNDENKNKLHRPDATILCYPVINGGKYANRNSFVNLTGSEAESELWQKMSLEKRVDKFTPPAFLWHTYEDSGVVVENSMLYAMALRNSQIPFEMHIYTDGDHGLSLVSDETYWAVDKFTRRYPWMQQSIEWLNLRFGITDIHRS